MADTTRLIDFHTNCSCGKDIAATLDVGNDPTLGPMLALHVRTAGVHVGQRVPVATATAAFDDDDGGDELDAGLENSTDQQAAELRKHAAGASKPGRGGRGRVQSP